jgi:ribosomal protein L37AE/L43A
VATEPQAQRRWRAACPNCGAPVEFRSAASPIAVCSFCRSTLAREGEALRRIGRSAELFDDHSPLQRGAAGRFQGEAFTLVGRLQLRYDGGTWNEWHAWFDHGRSGWLSEDNGRYVMAFDAPLRDELPAPAALQPGARRLLDGRLWDVASTTRVRVQAAEGELPAPPNLQDEYLVVDLRSASGEVATLDYAQASQPPQWSVGRSVELADLALTGLAEARDADVGARAAACPSCGTALQIQLASTKSVACHQCHAVVDVSAGVGGDLAHFAQARAAAREPQIPLGRTGTLALSEKAGARPWQMVGYVERQEIATDADDDASAWREYLLYNREAGFAFLVDSDDGWSWVVPITGAPSGRGSAVVWNGRSYSRRHEYSSEVRYVAGEFYWKLERGERTRHADYAAGPHRLNREQTAGEVTWSAGDELAADTVAKAFGLPALRADVAPLSRTAGGRTAGSATVVWVIAAMIAVVVLMSMCSSDDCDDLRRTFGEASNEYQQCKRSGAGATGFRTRGGSFGGFGTGGGHK